jgi:hypothetical protein
MAQPNRPIRGVVRSKERQSQTGHGVGQECGSYPGPYRARRAAGGHEPGRNRRSGVGRTLVTRLYPAGESAPSRRIYGAQSPGDPGPGAGPAKGGPDQMSIRPQDRSTRLASPFSLFAVFTTSPSCTSRETRTRPLGDRASTRQGSDDRRLAGISSACPAATVATGVSLTTSVTVREVSFEIETLIEAAGTVPGAVHAASRATKRARAEGLIDKETMRAQRRRRKADHGPETPKRRREEARRRFGLGSSWREEENAGSTLIIAGGRPPLFSSDGCPRRHRGPSDRLGRAPGGTAAD